MGLRTSVLGLLCLVVLTSIGAKADEQKANNNVCTYYHLLDYVYDNVLTYIDFICDYIRIPLIASNGGVIKDVQRQLGMVELFLWAFPLTGEGLPEIILTGGVKLEDFLQRIIERRYTPEFQGEISNLCRLIMKYFNYEGNETTLERSEWQHFMDMYNVTAEEATTAFNKLDRNRDDLISFDEYYAAGLSFFINGTDPNSAWFCGLPTTCDAVRKGAAPTADPIALGSITLPSNETISSMKVLESLLRRVPQFPYLRSVLGPIGILTNFLGLGGLLGV